MGSGLWAVFKSRFKKKKNLFLEEFSSSAFPCVFSASCARTSAFCWPTHSTHPQRPILQRGHESSEVTAKPLQSSGQRQTPCRSPPPPPNPILVLPQRPVPRESQRHSLQDGKHRPFSLQKPRQAGGNAAGGSPATLTVLSHRAEL